MPEVSDPTHIGTGACADAPVFRHLAPDVHIAGIDGHVVVLKLSQDRYFNLSHQHSQGLRRLIGWRSDGDIPVDVLLATQAMFDAQGILAPGAHATPTLVLRNAICRHDSASMHGSPCPPTWLASRGCVT